MRKSCSSEKPACCNERVALPSTIRESLVHGKDPGQPKINKQEEKKYIYI